MGWFGARRNRHDRDPAAIAISDFCVSILFDDEALRIARKAIRNRVKATVGNKSLMAECESGDEVAATLLASASLWAEETAVKLFGIDSDVREEGIANTRFLIVAFLAELRQDSPPKAP